MAQAVNNYTITGNIAQKPELKKTKNGKAYAFITIAVSGVSKDSTQFIPFIAWDKLAENVTKYCGKGDCISVMGAINIVKKEDKSSYIQLVADSVTFLHKAQKKEQAATEPEPVKHDASADPFEPVASPDIFSPF